MLWINDWRVQPELNRIARGDEVVSLQPRAMDMLCYLAEHQGQVVGPDEFLDAFWKGTLTGDAAIHKNIAVLRRCLGDDARHPRYIETIPKRGYRLIATVVDERSDQPETPTAHPTRAVALEAVGATIIPGGLESEDSAAPSDRVLKTPRRVNGDALEQPPVGRRTRSRRTTTIVGVAVSIAVVAAIAAWQADWLGNGGPATVENALRFQPSLSAGPSIAVMAFSNLSGDPAQDYFSDGLTEDIVAALGRFSNLTVLARNATLHFKDQAWTPAEVGRQLGVDYLLDGSVRRAGNQVRVSAQLIDAATGRHLWSNQYENELEDLFAMQDDITRNVVGAMSVKLTRLESERAARKAPEELEAYDYVLRGWDLLRQQQRSAHVPAREMFRQAIAVDPDYAAGYAGLGAAHILAVRLGYTEFVGKEIERAEALATRALALDPDNVRARGVLALVYIQNGEYGRGAAQLRHALAINPSNAESYKVYGSVLLYSGHEDKAIEWLEAALRLDPNMEALRVADLASAYYLNARYEDAVATAHRAAREQPDYYLAYAYLAAAYAQLGLTEKATDAAGELLRRRPFVTIDWLNHAMRDPDDAAHLAEGLDKAGLKSSLTGGELRSARLGGAGS